jgi:hypothetical protein
MFASMLNVWEIIYHLFTDTKKKGMSFYAFVDLWLRSRSRWGQAESFLYKSGVGFKIRESIFGSSKKNWFHSFFDHLVRLATTLSLMQAFCGSSDRSSHVKSLCGTDQSQVPCLKSVSSLDRKEPNN